MKRVNFKDLNLSLNEVLSRQDMKKIKGGYGYSGNGYCYYQCKRPDGTEYGTISTYACTSNKDCSATCTSPDTDASYCDTAN